MTKNKLNRLKYENKKGLIYYYTLHTHKTFNIRDSVGQFAKDMANLLSSWRINYDVIFTYDSGASILYVLRKMATILKKISLWNHHERSHHLWPN